MLNFQAMIKPRDRFHVYGGCYIDLIMGCGVAVTYIQLGEDIHVLAFPFESCTINYLDLISCKNGLHMLSDKAPYMLYTNNIYVKNVVLNAHKWRNQGILEERANPEVVTTLLEDMDRLGTGELKLSSRQYSRDELMIHLLKYSKHLFHEAQIEMINRRTSTLPKDIFGSTSWKLQELAGSILWKTPMSISQFEKKMAKSRERLKVVSSLRLVSNQD